MSSGIDSRTLEVLSKLAALDNAQQGFNLLVMKCLIKVIEALPVEAQAGPAAQITELIGMAEKLQDKQKILAEALTQEIGKHER